MKPQDPPLFCCIFWVNGGVQDKMLGFKSVLMGGGGFGKKGEMRHPVLPFFSLPSLSKL